MIVSSAFWLACGEPILSLIAPMPLEMRGLETVSYTTDGSWREENELGEA